jgi:hypothetical protein
MKQNPPLAHWNPEALACFVYFLLLGASLLVSYARESGGIELAGGVLFVFLGSGGIIHALRSRSRWIKAGGGPLPRQQELVTKFVREYKPLLLVVGVGAMALVIFGGYLIPWRPREGDHFHLFAGMWLCMGIASHLHYHRARRWLEQQEAEVPRGESCDSSVL